MCYMVEKYELLLMFDWTWYTIPWLFTIYNNFPEIPVGK